MTKNPRDVVLKPVVSEKSYALLDANTFTFVVHPDANKTEIKEAVQAIFSVRVTNVNTLNRKGKRKRVRQTAGVLGVRKATKRALVTVHPDDRDRIDIFEAK
jgi:large subunit ribosomal protein L23